MRERITQRLYASKNNVGKGPDEQRVHLTFLTLVEREEREGVRVRRGEENMAKA